MDIASLSEAIHDDLEAVLVAVDWSRPDAVTLTIECDDWEGSASRRRFKLVCREPAEVKCSLGPFDSLTYQLEHPLLLDHQGQHSQLYFSSAPASPGEVFLAAHAAIDAVVVGWRDPGSYLCHEPGLFESVIASGHGLLARGPEPVIAALAERLEGMLRVNSLPSHSPAGQYTALTIDSQWVVCKAVAVTELGS